MGSEMCIRDRWWVSCGLGSSVGRLCPVGRPWRPRSVGGASLWGLSRWGAPVPFFSWLWLRLLGFRCSGGRSWSPCGGLAALWRCSARVVWVFLVFCWWWVVALRASPPPASVVLVLVLAAGWPLSLWNFMEARLRPWRSPPLQIPDGSPECQAYPS